MKTRIISNLLKVLLTICLVNSAFLSSCTTSTVDTSDLTFPFEEKIAIGGFLFAGDSIEGIHLSATIPIVDTTSFKPLNGVEASIGVDGNSYPLSLQKWQTPTGKLQSSTFQQLQQQNLLYRPVGLVAIPGKTYTITVRWNGKTASAVTTVPRPITPDSVGISTDEKRLSILSRAVLTPRPKEAYSIVQTHTGRARNRLYTLISPYSPMVRTEEARADGKLLVSTSLPTFDKLSEGLTWLYDSLDNFQSHLSVFAYDGQYWDYYQSEQQKTRTADIVGVPLGVNARWNVKGDGIGLFIGVATSRTPLKKK